MDDKKLSDQIKTIYTKITENNLDDFATYLKNVDEPIDVVDEFSISPLQHACYLGNEKAVQLLLEKGANVNYIENTANYTTLHFAALSGNVNIVQALLKIGSNAKVLNSASKTASEIAEFVQNFKCSTVINKFISKSEIENYFQDDSESKEVNLPSKSLEAFHDFLLEINIHPVRIAINLKKSSDLIANLLKVRNICSMLADTEMEKFKEEFESQGLKYHYLSVVVEEIMRCQLDFPDTFINNFMKRVLKQDKSGQSDYLDYLVNYCQREFPFKNRKILEVLVGELKNEDSRPPYEVLFNIINAPYKLKYTDTCTACFTENSTKVCSRCKKVKYCDVFCQKLHWFQHKKYCASPESTNE